MTGLMAALALASMTIGLSAQGARVPAPTGDVKAGQALYTKMTCYYCHGTAGQGGIAGARIALVQRSADAFIRYVRRPTGNMPAYTDRILSDVQLNDIYAFLRSLPAARPAKEIPLLSQPKDGK
jgi:mono/diheme cytochrome c family protein